MKFSEMWLREWVNIKIDSETLSKQITMAGLEVNCIQSVANAFDGVVIGEIIECWKHPISDNLFVTKVNIGSENLINIICSEPNCRQGLKVAVATTNVALLGNTKIKPVQIQEKISKGTLCSFSELGISDNQIGIIELPSDAPIGVDIREYLKLNDKSFEINVTPNRADCLSIIGIARDVALINNTELNELEVTPIVTTITTSLPIQVDVPEGCPRYLGRIIQGINVNVSTPLWIRERLRRCGFCSTDAVSDIAKYVLLEFGQPIHIFDQDCIEGGIIVRMAREGETLLLLNGNQTKLNKDTLVIADYKKVLGIAGISVGKNFGINKHTKNVLIECAFFDPLIIMGRARRYGIITDASYRYERGVDFAIQYKAMDRVICMITDICGGKVGPMMDRTSEDSLPKRALITLRRNKLNSLIGFCVSTSQVNNTLRRLGCKVVEDHNEWRIVAPSWRFDIEIEEDIIEEIVRIYGYNIIPDNNPIKIQLKEKNCKSTILSLNRVKTMLHDKGYHEVITYSFVEPKFQQLIHPDKKALILPNPISREMSAMRLSLWTGLLKTIIYNQNRQQDRVRIFESGLCFIPDIQAELGIRQEFMLAGGISGNRYEEHWDFIKCQVDFYDIKGDLESIFDLTGILSEIEFRSISIPALHPGQSASIYLHNKRIGFIGVIHPRLERKLDLKSRTVVFEVEWNKIIDRPITKAKALSQFPIYRRDIAIIVSENVLVSDIFFECKKVDVDQIVDINVFDIYRGEGIAEGYKSLAISLILHNTNRVLVEKEISAIITKCIEVLKKRFQASLRNCIYDNYKE